MPTWKLASLTDAQKLALFSKDTLLGPGYTNEPILLSFEVYFHQPIKTASITTTDAWNSMKSIWEGLWGFPSWEIKWSDCSFIKVDGINMYTQFGTFARPHPYHLSKWPGQGTMWAAEQEDGIISFLLKKVKTEKIPKLSSVGNIWERVRNGDTWLSPQVHGVRSSMQWNPQVSLQHGKV